MWPVFIEDAGQFRFFFIDSTELAAPLREVDESE